MSMLYLASSIATGAVRLSGRSIVQLLVVVFFFLADVPLSSEDEVEQRGPC